MTKASPYCMLLSWTEALAVNLIEQKSHDSLFQSKGITVQDERRTSFMENVMIKRLASAAPLLCVFELFGL